MYNSITNEETLITFHNTNKLLSLGFNGVKTGITPTAGPCMAASFIIKLPCKELIKKEIFKKVIPRDYEIIIVVLGAKSV